MQKHLLNSTLSHTPLRPRARITRIMQHTSRPANKHPDPFPRFPAGRGSDDLGEVRPERSFYGDAVLARGGGCGGDVWFGEFFVFVLWVGGVFVGGGLVVGSYVDGDGDVFRGVEGG